MIPNNSMLTEQNLTTIGHTDFQYIFVVMTLFSAIVFLVGVTGNLLVLVVIFRNKEMSNATNLFLANLGIADLLVLLVCLPSSLLELHARDVWLMGEAMCRLVPFLENLACHVSVITMLAISFERYYAICCPFERIYACSKTRAVRIIACVWMVGTISTIPFIAMSYTEEVNHIQNGRVLVCRTPVDILWKHIYVNGLLVFLFVIPFLVLMVLYFNIGRRLVQDEANLRSENGTNKRFAVGRKQVVFMLIAIIIFFFICLVPIRVFILWYVYSSSEAKSSLGHEGYLHIFSFVRILLFINSAGNPIFYNIVSTKFRDACKNTLGCVTADRRRYSMSAFGGSSSYRRGTYMSDAINLGSILKERQLRDGGLLTVNQPNHQSRPRRSCDYIFYEEQQEHPKGKRSSL